MVMMTAIEICFNTFSLVAFYTSKSTVPGHFTTLWKSRSTSTLSAQLAQEAAEYYYSAQVESVKLLLISAGHIRNGL
jgi:hypothetical protein